MDEVEEIEEVETPENVIEEPVFDEREFEEQVSDLTIKWKRSSSKITINGVDYDRSTINDLRVVLQRAVAQTRKAHK